MVCYTAKKSKSCFFEFVFFEFSKNYKKCDKNLFLNWLKTTKNGNFKKFSQNFNHQNANEIDISKLTNENIF